MIHRLPKAATNRHPGLNFPGVCGSSCFEEESGATCKSVISSLGSASLCCGGRIEDILKDQIDSNYNRIRRDAGREVKVEDCNVADIALTQGFEA